MSAVLNWNSQNRLLHICRSNRTNDNTSLRTKKLTNAPSLAGMINPVEEIKAKAEAKAEASSREPYRLVCDL